MPRPSNTEERRKQIAGALIKVMARRGYDGASVAGIAKAARLTPGLVHYHFASKQEILLAALDELVARHAARLEERLGAAGEDDPLAQVAAFIDVHLAVGAHADPEALACWVLISGEALREPKVRAGFHAALARLSGRLTAIIRRGVERSVFAAVEAEPAAAALLAAIQGYFVLAATARTLIPRGSAAAATKQMAEGLLRPRRHFPGPEVRS